ncbi:GtrA family protein [Treponema sp.]|uniref:GtrA family protein n=1 Tax=Treponema sp. TaxID=166 RepID=UPI003F078BDD
MYLSLIDEKLLKFILSGIINTIVGSLVMFILYNVAHLSYWISSAGNYIAGGLCSFFLSKFFVFKNSKRNTVQILLFIVNLAVCYFVAYGAAQKIIYKILSEHTEQFRGNVSLIVGMVLYTFLNYIGQRLFVFKVSPVEKSEKKGKESVIKTLPK